MLSFLDYKRNKNQTQKREIGDICPKLKFNRPLPPYIPTIRQGLRTLFDLYFFPILLQGNFSNWRYLFLWSDAIEFKCIFLSLFSGSVRKYISVKTHWYLNQLIDLQCKSICRFLWDRGLYRTGFSNNYRLTTENLDVQNNTADN